MSFFLLAINVQFRRKLTLSSVPSFNNAIIGHFLVCHYRSLSYTVVGKAASCLFLSTRRKKRYKSTSYRKYAYRQPAAAGRPRGFLLNCADTGGLSDPISTTRVIPRLPLYSCVLKPTVFPNSYPANKEWDIAQFWQFSRA